LDEIVRDYKNAKNNDLKTFEIDASNQAAVVRHWKQYWYRYFFYYSMGLLVITFLVAFYSSYSVVGIFGVFVLSKIFSQKIYMWRMFNNHHLTRKEAYEIRDKIFSMQMKSSMLFFISIALMFCTYLSYFITKSLFIIKYTSCPYVEVTIDFLSKAGSFSIENELFAYANAVSILILLLLKLYEKWSR
jgi:hypothetical protein